MSQNNQFHQYGYDHYLKAPKKSRAKSSGGGVGAKIMNGLQSPMVATGALLVTGIVFASIIIMAYPSRDDVTQEIPIVRADLRPIKTAPEDGFGGVDEVSEQSSVMEQIGQPREEDITANVENLLAPSDAEFESKEKALETAMADRAPVAVEPVVGALNENVTPTLIQEAKKLEQQHLEGAVVPHSVDVASSSLNQEMPKPADVIQKIEDGGAVMPSVPVQDVQTEQMAVDGQDKRTSLHAAATSPETIDFVRSVLNEDQNAQDKSVEQNVDEKIKSDSDVVGMVDQDATQEPQVFEDAGETTKADKKNAAVEEQKQIKKSVESKAEKVAKIAPAAGAASPSVNIKSGNYFAQLASITERGRASAEYTKLQKKFAVLSGVNFRVQEANLDKGRFFRIQAGPMSKDSAKQVCEAIKNQNGGCIVTK